MGLLGKKKIILSVFLLIGLVGCSQQAKATDFNLCFIAVENPKDMVNNTMFCHLWESTETIDSISYITVIDEINYYTENMTAIDISENVQFVYSANPYYVADLYINWTDVGGWHNIEMSIYFVDLDGLNQLVRFSITFLDDYFVEPPPDDDNDEIPDDDDDTDEDEDEDDDENENNNNGNNGRRRRRRVRRGWYRHGRYIV